LLEKMPRLSDTNTVMRKSLAIPALLLVLGGVCGHGQPYSVLLNNPEPSTFHYVIDPPELSNLDPNGTIFLGILYDYFADTGAVTRFQALPPGATQRIEGLTAGSHLLLGFFAPAGAQEYPVRILGLQAGGGIEERYYTIYGEPSLMAAKTGRGRLKDFTPLEKGGRPAAEVAGRETPPGPVSPVSQVQPAGQVPIRIDNSYEDWESVPFLASFTADYAPGYFTRERFAGKFETLALDQSQHWPDGGTRLSEVKGLAAGERLYLFCSAHTAISGNLSVLLYFHNLRKPGSENSVTLELVPASAAQPGLAVLWQKGKQPEIVGSLSSGTFFMEAEVDFRPVQAALGSSPGVRSSFDLTASYFDKAAGAYEEFFFTTLYLDDIPSLWDIRAPAKY